MEARSASEGFAVLGNTFGHTAANPPPALREAFSSGGAHALRGIV